MEFLTTGDAAKLLDLSRETVEYHVQTGRLRVVARTRSGMKLLDVREVEAFRDERAAKAAERPPRAGLAVG